MKHKIQRKGFKQLNLNDRIQIEIQYSQGKSLGKIAECLGKERNKSTVCREIDGAPRKGRGRYGAYKANCRALERVKDRGKREKLKNEATRMYTSEKLKLGWSPEQVSIRIGIDLGKDYTISPEAIYQFIYAQVYRGGNGLVKKGIASRGLIRNLPWQVSWTHKKPNRELPELPHQKFSYGKL